MSGKFDYEQKPPSNQSTGHPIILNRQFQRSIRSCLNKESIVAGLVLVLLSPIDEIGIALLLGHVIPGWIPTIIGIGLALISTVVWYYQNNSDPTPHRPLQGIRRSSALLTLKNGWL